WGSETKARPASSALCIAPGGLLKGVQEEDGRARGVRNSIAPQRRHLAEVLGPGLTPASCGRPPSTMNPIRFVRRRFWNEAVRPHLREQLRYSRAPCASLSLALGPRLERAGLGPPTLLPPIACSRNLSSNATSQSRPEPAPTVVIPASVTHSIEGVVGRVLYHNDAGFCIFSVKKVKIDGTGMEGELKIVGQPNVPPRRGSRIKVETRPATEHPSHGVQYQYVEHENLDVPFHVKEYLMTFPSIGKKSADAIWSHFGYETWDVVSENPGRLKEVKELAQGRAESLAKHLTELEDYDVHIQELFGYIHKYISIAECRRIKCEFEMLKLGKRPLDIIRKDPYSLIRVGGLSFVSADHVATDIVGISKDDPTRFKACVDDALLAKNNDGNTAIKHVDFLQLLTSWPYLFQKNKVYDLIPQMIKDKVIVNVQYDGESYVQHCKYHDWERRIQQYLANIQRSNTSLPRVDVEGRMVEVEENSDFESFSDNQKKGIINALGEHKMTVLTGGPGTGALPILQYNQKSAYVA
ncbi:hypothetical protein ACHAWF_011639, partial [Thalassiosira exigua]